MGGFWKRRKKEKVAKEVVPEEAEKKPSREEILMKICKKYDASYMYDGLLRITDYVNPSEDYERNIGIARQHEENYKKAKGEEEKNKFAGIASLNYELGLAGALNDLSVRDKKGKVIEGEELDIKVQVSRVNEALDGLLRFPGKQDLREKYSEISKNIETGLKIFAEYRQQIEQKYNSSEEEI